MIKPPYNDNKFAIELLVKFTIESSAYKTPINRY